MHKILALVIFSIFMIGGAYSASVGAAPGFFDLGEVERGDSVEQEIYVTTNFDSNFTIDPKVTSAFRRQMFADFRSERSETSEESIVNWIQLEEQVNVDPEDTFTERLEDGTSVNADGRFNMLLEVPQDAEPGYHYGRIRLNPEIQGDTSATGTVNWGETIPMFRFKVPGNVDRTITVQDVRGFRTDENSASVEVLLRNTGTVTASAQNFEIDILNSRGESVETLTISGVKLSPEESEWTNARWSGGNVDEGDYELDGEIDYLTGQSYASGSFSLDDIVQVIPDDSPETVGDEEERETVPLWLVFMALALMTVLMWSFDIEPFWILAIIGGLTFAAFIFLSGISNYLVVILLMMAGIMVYGVM